MIISLSEVRQSYYYQGEVVLFSVASSAFVFLYRSGYRTNNLYHKILRFSSVKEFKSLKWNFRNLIGDGKKPEEPHSLCHNKGSCIVSALKVSIIKLFFLISAS